MTLSIEQSISEEQSVIIVSHPTGIFYTGQCGGLGCTHPEYEGFAILAGTMGQDLDICGQACYNLYRMPGERDQLANEFDEYAKDLTKGWPYKVRFDFSRIDQMQESWIPILISGNIGYPFSDNETLKDVPGVLFTNNNCD